MIAFRYDSGIDSGYPYSTSDFEESQSEEAIREEIDWDLELISTDPVKLVKRLAVDYGDGILTSLGSR